MIQSLVRMYLERKQFRTLKTAAVTIQSHCRGTIARNVTVPARREELRIAKLRENAATRIQKTWKMVLQRRAFLLRLEQIRRERKILQSVVSIQRFWRRYRGRKAIKTEKVRMNRAATVIQSCWKTYQVRKVYRTRMRSIVLIQSVIRRYYVVKKVVPRAREEFKVRRIHRAATVIQKCFRGYRIRKAFMLQCQVWINSKLVCLRTGFLTRVFLPSISYRLPRKL